MWGGPCLAHSPLSPADGRFRGAAPGHTGETLGPPSLTYLGVGEASPLPVPRQPVIACTCSSFLQPGKLTEAFKYFLQGMGYSKYTSISPHPTDWWQAARWGWHTCQVVLSRLGADEVCITGDLDAGSFSLHGPHCS